MTEHPSIVFGPGAGLWFVNDEAPDRPRQVFRLDHPLRGQASLSGRDLAVALALLRHALAEREASS